MCIRDRDLTSKTVTQEIAVGSTPEGISIDHTTQQALVANWGSNSVSVIDLKSQTVVNTIETGSKSRAFGRFISH